MKKVLPYVFALAMGVVVMMLIAPSLRENRPAGRSFGGEVLIPAICVAGTAVVRHRKELTAEARMLDESYNSKEEDDE